jgi:hypothetical protein
MSSCLNNLTSWIALASNHERWWIQEIEHGRDYTGPLPYGITSLNHQGSSRHYKLKLVRLIYIPHCVNVAVLLLAKLTQGDAWDEGSDEGIEETKLNDVSS